MATTTIDYDVDFEVTADSYYFVTIAAIFFTFSFKQDERSGMMGSQGNCHLICKALQVYATFEDFAVYLGLEFPLRFFTSILLSI